MKRLIALLMTSIVFMSGCSVPHDAPAEPDGEGESTYAYEDVADINPDDYFMVLLVGSRDMTVYDMQSPSSISMHTFELDDDEIGTWHETDSFRMCHYKVSVWGTTSPENWYLIDIKGDNEVYLDSYNTYSVTHNGENYRQNDNHKQRFILSGDEVKYDDGTFYQKIENLKLGE